MLILASRRKSLMADSNSGTNLFNLDMLNIMPDKILVNIAHTCKVDMVKDMWEWKDNLEFIKKLKSRQHLGSLANSKGI